MKPYNFMKLMFKSFRKVISFSLITAFVGSSLYVPEIQAGEMVMSFMPKPGTMVHLSPHYTPAYLDGIVIHPDDALKFDFLVHQGEGELDEGQKKLEYNKLIKYFLASLTVPDKDQWVNLSPYEKNRIVEADFGRTGMGRDLLTQDYLLKQITSSLMYPESGLGKVFWGKVFERAYKEYGTTNIQVNTFNKVWIVPDDALIYESGNTAYVVKSHLKVMLEEDYLSLAKHVSLRTGEADAAISDRTPDTTHTVASKIIREVILPEIEKEVNEGKNFAMLRQIFSGMVLATWYKNALKESLLGKVYADKSKVQGVDQNPKNNEAIYRNYLSAFKKGVYNYIREDTDRYTNQIIPRKYFAGGFFLPDRFETTEKVSPSTLNGEVNIRDEAVTAEIDPAQRALVPTDKAMAVNYIEPYQNIKQMYDLLPVNIRSLMANILVRSEVSPDAVANLMDEIKKLYTRMKLNTENYHNDMHHLLVTQGALMLAANAGLIKEKRDLIVTFAAALFHDFQLREVYPSGVGKPGSDAWVNETLGIPGTDKGGQLPDLLGIVKYNGPAINNARYDSKQITKEEKLNIQRAFRLLRNGEDLEQVYYEIEAIIRRTDFPSDVKRANDFYWKSATRIRDEMDNLTVEWADKNIVMTDELLNKTIDHLNSEYAIIFKNFAEEKVLIKNEEERDIQKKWLDRQKGIELNFLEALRKVDANRRLKIYQIANLVELSDQSASVWIGSADVTKGLTLGLKEELPFVSLGTNYPMFYAPNLLVSRGLRRLNYLPLNFKANFINNLAYFAHYSTDYAKGKGNAANAKVPDFIFQNMLKSQSEWEIKDKKNVLKGLGVIEDRDGVIKEKPQLSSVPEMAGAMLQPLVRSASSDRAMTKGGIDLNAANLDLRIKRDGNGVPLPVSQQDLTQLGRISGFVPKIIEIKPVSSLPFFNEVK